MDHTFFSDMASLMPYAFQLVGSIFAFLFMTIVIGILLRALAKSKISTLFTSTNDPTQISTTKFWQNIAYAAATVAFLGVNLTGKTLGIPLESIWIIYLGVIGSNAVLSKWIAAKYNGPQAQPQQTFRSRRNAIDEYPQRPTSKVDDPDA